MATETLLNEQRRLVEQRKAQAEATAGQRPALNPVPLTTAAPPPESDPRVVRQRLESESEMRGRR